MTHTRVSEALGKLVARTIKSSRFVALVIVATFTSLAMQPAQAQSSDTWKSVAIIGGSTVAGAYIGHRVAGSTGAWIGAAAGASTGYEIDKRRRANEYYNQSTYGDGGYYGNNAPYYGNDGNYGGPPDGAYPYPSGYQSNNYDGNNNRFSRRR